MKRKPVFVLGGILLKALQPLIASLPADYRIEMGGSIEESANAALAKIFPVMIAPRSSSSCCRCDPYQR